MLTTLMRLASALALAATLAAPAAAQRGYGQSGQMFSQGAAERNQAGQFDYYALVLSWSPTHCATIERSDPDPQCNRRDGRRYAFVLHGLWPQHERGFPENCRTPGRPYVPQNVIDAMLDIMPSSKLVIHEYRKHGTCSGMTPSEYFTTARKMFTQINVPERYHNTQEGLMVAPGDLADDFLQANPSLKPDMLAISCGGAGNRLREIRVCFDKAGQFRGCGRNEDQRRLCSAQKVYLPPVRSAGIGPVPAPAAGSDKRAPLPGPKVLRMFPGGQ